MFGLEIRKLIVRFALLTKGLYNQPNYKTIKFSKGSTRDIPLPN